MSIVVETGYLETAYLSELSYLAGLVENQISAQIEMKIVDNPENVNAQTEMRIFDSSKINTQTEMRVYKDDPVSTQIDQRIYAEDQVLSQVLMRIFVEDEVLSQVLMKIEAEDNVLSQVEQRIYTDEKILSQVLMRIYAEDDILTQALLRINSSQNILSQVEQRIDPDIDPLVSTQVAQRIENFENPINTQTELRIYDDEVINTQTELFINDFEDPVYTQVERKILDYENPLNTQVKIGTIGHYICGGYLEAEYLSEPYLAYRLCADVRSQIVFSTFTDNEINTQSQMKIDRTDDDPIVNVQVEQRIENYENPILAQVKMRIEDFPHNVLTQISQRIFNDVLVGSQVKQRIFHEENINTQIDQIRAFKIGAQISQVIYNVTQLRLLCNFASRGIEALGGNNWTSVQAVDAGDYSPNNLNTDIIEQRTQTSSVALWQLRCNTGNPNTFVDTIAILEHNLSRGATVEVSGSDDPSFGSIKFNFNMTVETENMYYIAPELPKIPAQYYQFTIQDPGNISGKLYIGTIIFGSATILTVQEQFINPVTYGFKHFKDSLQTEGFTSVSNDRALRKFLNLTYDSLNRNGGNFKSLREYILEAKTDLKCLIIPRPTLPSSLAVFSKLTQLPEEQHTATDDDNWYVSITFDWDESL